MSKNLHHRQWESEEELWPGGPKAAVLHFELLDDNGNPIDGREAFRQLMPGIHVKYRGDKLSEYDKALPMFAIIGEQGTADPGMVCIEDAMEPTTFYHVPHDIFFKLYEVD